MGRDRRKLRSFLSFAYWSRGWGMVFSPTVMDVSSMLDGLSALSLIVRKEQNQNVHCIELEISESKKETAKAKDAALRQQGWTLFSKRQCPKWIDYA